jgi:hypothetical protein
VNSLLRSLSKPWFRAASYKRIAPDPGRIDRETQNSGKTYLLETALRADFALINAFLADYLGDPASVLTARDFNPVVAMAPDTTIVTADDRHGPPPGARNGRTQADRCRRPDGGTREARFAFTRSSLPKPWFRAASYKPITPEPRSNRSRHATLRNYIQ